MSKRTFVIFGLLVVVLAVVIPWIAFHSRGDANSGELKVPANLKAGQAIFQTNCGTCHTLYAAGTDGNYGPNLDELLAQSGAPSGPTAATTIKGIEIRVLNALEHGATSTFIPGRMPAGILNPSQAKEVAQFVAHTAGEG